MKLGKKLKALRKAKKMTLKELSQKSGVQVATLSRMENDIMTGTLASYISICKALGVSLADFYREVEDAHKPFSLTKKKESSISLAHPKEATTTVLTTQIAEKKMMPVLIHIKKDGQTQKEEDKVGMEKFVYVLEGRIRADIGKEIYNLSKGDSIYFGASMPHVFFNIGKSEARLLSITSPPVL